MTRAWVHSVNQAETVCRETRTRHMSGTTRQRAKVTRGSGAVGFLTRVLFRIATSRFRFEM